MNIIVTGASRGIGYEITKQLCNMKNNRVIAIARNIETLTDLSVKVSKFNNGSFLYPIDADLGKKGFEKSLIRNILSKINKVDVLINNAGTLIKKTVMEYSSADFDQLFNVNVKAPFLIIQNLLPFFNQPSHIVNISSMGGFQGSEKFQGLSLYSASKGAIAILSECLAAELKEKNISVNCIAPGAVQTGMLKKAFPGYKAQITAAAMATYIVDFSTKKNNKRNGKIIPFFKSTP